MKICKTCGAEVKRNPKESAKQWAGRRFCDRVCSEVANRKQRVCACGCGGRPLPGRKWMAGHRPVIGLNAQGYRRIWIGKTHPLADSSGLCLEHRLVMYEAGIEIPPGHQIHHLNGVKTDNRVENLVVVSAADHARLHAEERGTIANQYGTFPLKARSGGPQARTPIGRSASSLFALAGCAATSRSDSSLVTT